MSIYINFNVDDLLLPKTFTVLSMPTTYQFKGQSSYMLGVTLKKMNGEKEKTYIYYLLQSRLFRPVTKMHANPGFQTAVSYVP